MARATLGSVAPSLDFRWSSDGVSLDQVLKLRAGLSESRKGRPKFFFSNSFISSTSTFA
jgi:hypothetical protein